MTQPAAAQVAAQAPDSNVRFGVVSAVDAAGNASVQVQGSGVTNAGWLQTYCPAVGDAVLIVLSGQTWTVMGRVDDEPRGVLKAFAYAVLDSAAIGAETVILTTGPVTFEPGHVYAAKFECDVQPSVGSSFAGFMLRRNNVAGALLRFGWGFGMASNSGFGVTCGGEAFICNTTGAVITDTVVLTLTAAIAGTVTARSSGAGLANNRARYLAITDRGSVARYPWAQQV